MFFPIKYNLQYTSFNNVSLPNKLICLMLKSHQYNKREYESISVNFQNQFLTFHAHFPHNFHLICQTAFSIFQSIFLVLPRKVIHLVTVLFHILLGKLRIEITVCFLTFQALVEMFLLMIKSTFGTVVLFP